MQRWHDGNHFTLLENGEQFFPRVFACIANARTEVVLETFILFEDKVGLQLHEALVAAARRGVQVDATIDGWGSPDLSERFIASLCEAGVRLHVFDPGPRPFGLRPNLLRRLHRKIVVVDGEVAFIGGINYSADHLGDFGPQAKQDYSVEVRGPLVGEIHRFAHAALAAGSRHTPHRRWWRWRRQARFAPGQLAHAGSARAMLVTRDNGRHTTDIERQYRIAIRAARERVVIANAYFFPGYRLIRDLRRAARRGVDVRLILQGTPDMAIVKVGASALYNHLLKAGVRIFEYCERPLHGKVALVDDEWVTVGSSNLDPLSLQLNLEANVVIRDRDFNALLYERLDALVRDSCRQVQPESVQAAGGLRQLLRSFIAFHLVRIYPTVSAWLPRHRPRLMPAMARPLAPAGAPPIGQERR
ncbi:cardiolipin synthase ClsB [Ramlibacter tataouinensis]|uniref:cardiolipin synthase ClsB n=1 Tax=Ramlibacter tataouinensis TaxID=94132 RepID=UPI0022F3BFB8|nr:cardiolipin synthase ClsB [Ramlibacter tataouinensis]WBY00034.1 cardiolipin synthase ClsB [Ramlibacter tataouinensis]